MVRCWCFNNDSDNTYSDNGIVSERHYGCYRLGILIAFVIVLILIIGTVPVFFASDNSKLILIVTIVSVLVVGIIVFIYYEWQHRQALNQRERCKEGWNVHSRNNQILAPRNNRRHSYVDTLNETSFNFYKTKTIVPNNKNGIVVTSLPKSTSTPNKYSQI